MGAFMALPVAALITSIITNATKTYGTTYDVIYHSTYESKDGPQQAPDRERRRSTVHRHRLTEDRPDQPIRPVLRWVHLRWRSWLLRSLPCSLRICA